MSGRRTALPTVAVTTSCIPPLDHVVPLNPDIFHPSTRTVITQVTKESFAFRSIYMFFNVINCTSFTCLFSFIYLFITFFSYLSNLRYTKFKLYIPVYIVMYWSGKYFPCNNETVFIVSTSLI